MDAISQAIGAFLGDFAYALFLYLFNIILSFTGDISLPF